MRSRRSVIVLLLVLCAVAVASGAAAQNPAPGPIKPSAVLTFKHHSLTIVDSMGVTCSPINPSLPCPIVLRVKDGGYFAVKVIETDNRLFNYTITADTATDIKSASTTVETQSADTDRLDGPNSQAIVVMAHSSHFQRYRFQITLKAAAEQKGAGAPSGSEKGGATEAKPRPLNTEPPYTLYAASFDVWVQTKEDFSVTFNGGVAFSSLRDHKYFIKTTPPTTANGTATKSVEEDTDGRDQFRPDVVILATIQHPEKWKGFGVSFGFGTGDGASARYFAGPSWILGKNFILNAGWTGGKVAVLPTGQALHDAPINGDNTLTTLGSRFEHGFYAGIGFLFDSRKQSDFLGPLTSTQATANSNKDAAKPAEPAPAAQDLNQFAATYGQDPDTVTVSVADGKLKAEFKGTKKSGAVTLTADPKNPDHFAVDGDANAAVQFTRSGGKITKLEYSKTGAATIPYAKP